MPVWGRRLRAEKDTLYESYALMELAGKFIKAVYELNEKLGIPKRIEGIEEKDIDMLAAYADQEANPLYPVPVLWDREALKEVYRKARG